MSKRINTALLCVGLFFVLGMCSSLVASAQETPVETPTAVPTQPPVETPTATPVPVQPTNTPAVETPTPTPVVQPTETPTPTPTATPTPIAQQEGDFNNDGVIDDKDVEAIFVFFLSGQQPTADQLKYADINKDGAVTPQDAQDLYKKIHP